VFVLAAGGSFRRTLWRLGCKLRKPFRPSHLRLIRPQLTVLTRLADLVLLRLLRCLSGDPGVERLGAARTVAIRRRRLRSLERSMGEEGRIGSWALPLKDLMHA
jgi:hypothetical protein